MTFNHRALRGLIVTKGFTERDVAKKIGLTKETFSKKMNSKSMFNVDEIAKLTDLLNIDCNDIYKYFLVRE